MKTYPPLTRAQWNDLAADQAVRTPLEERALALYGDLWDAIDQAVLLDDTATAEQAVLAAFRAYAPAERASLDETMADIHAKIVAKYGEF